MGFHLARILTPGEDHIPEEQQPEGYEKKGWLQVVYHGEIRFARPCYMWGSFTPPTTLWLEKFADKFAVWVTTESGSEFMERDNHLVYVGFDPHEDTLPADILAAFPEKKLAFTDRWEAVVDDGAVDPSFTIRYTGDPENDVNPHPDPGGSVVLKVTQKDGSEAITLTRVAPGGENTELVMDKDQVRVTHLDSKSTMLLRLSDFVVLVDSGDGFRVEGKDANAVFTLGDGVVHAAQVEKLQALYEALKVRLDASDGHTHSVPASGLLDSLAAPVTGAATSLGPSPTISAPVWDAGINSTKVAFPDE